MNAVCEKYPNIPWIYNAKGQLKKENYDSCDALICALAYSNRKRYGEIDARVSSYEIKEDKQTGVIEVNYKVSVWDKVMEKKLVIAPPEPENNNAEYENDDAE